MPPDPALLPGVAMVSLASQRKGESDVRTTPMGIVFAFVFAFGQSVFQACER